MLLYVFIMFVTCVYLFDWLVITWCWLTCVVFNFDLVCCYVLLFVVVVILLCFVFWLLLFILCFVDLWFAICVIYFSFV